MSFCVPSYHFWRFIWTLLYFLHCSMLNLLRISYLMSDLHIRKCTPFWYNNMQFILSNWLIWQWIKDLSIMFNILFKLFNKLNKLPILQKHRWIWLLLIRINMLSNLPRRLIRIDLNIYLYIMQPRMCHLLRSSSNPMLLMQQQWY
jgi:hypothetical protein